MFLFLVAGIFFPKVSYAQCRTILGVTFTHYAVNSNSVCLNGHDSAFALTPGSIIPHYDDGQVRSTVKADLGQIKSAGYGLIRTVLWFTQDTIYTPWGQVRAPLGDEDAQRIYAFGSDIKAAGFSRWLVVLVPGTRSSPVCHSDRSKPWGHCFDQTTQETSVDFMVSVHKKLSKLNDENFEVEYDLAGEMCPSRWLGELANLQIENYLTALITTYTKNFGSQFWRVSCGGLPDDRMSLFINILKKIGETPTSLDMHFYDTDFATVQRKLSAGIKIARVNDLPLSIGEMFYENHDEAEAIGRVAHSENFCFNELIEWPLSKKDVCQINVAPPFRPDIVKSEVLR